MPEGISSSTEHPLIDVAKSAAIVLVFFGGLVITLFFAARLAGPLVPFAWETALVGRVPQLGGPLEAADAQKQQFLQALADRIAGEMAVPEEITVTVHLVDDDAVNAFATLGGHIVVFEGLWRLLDSENALAMLLAHEIAHVKNRDPIRSASGGLIASLAASLLLGEAGLLGDLVGGGNVLTALHFSREQERQADADAIRAVVGLYGHVAGAADLFARIRAAGQDTGQPPRFLASHPYLPERIVEIERIAAANGWSLTGPKTPLP